jgi:hypothetical protein
MVGSWYWNGFAHSEVDRHVIGRSSDCKEQVAGASSTPLIPFEKNIAMYINRCVAVNCIGRAR